MSDGRIIDFLGALSKALVDSDEKELNDEDVAHILAKYNADNHVGMSEAEVKKTAQEVFEHLDGDKSGTVTRAELLKGLFSLVDHDEDGMLSPKEFKSIVRSYAKFLKVDLRQGWGKKLGGWFRHLAGKDGKLSVPELLNWLKASNHGIHDLDDAVRSLGEHH